jgi:hypothetical protein
VKQHESFGVEGGYTFRGRKFDEEVKYGKFYRLFYRFFSVFI